MICSATSYNCEATTSTAAFFFSFLFSLFVFSNTVVSYIWIRPRARLGSCWPTQPPLGTSIFKQLRLKPRKMDIDLGPWLNGLNYRVVLVAGQQRERDKREEERREDEQEMATETKPKDAQRDEQRYWKDVETFSLSFCWLLPFLTLFYSIRLLRASHPLKKKSLKLRSFFRDDRVVAILVTLWNKV